MHYKHRRSFVCLWFAFFIPLVSWPCVQSSRHSRRHEHGQVYLSDESSSEEIFSYRATGSGGIVFNHTTEVGIFPPLGNLALHAVINSNATCGMRGPETYCKLVEHVPSTSRPLQCNECDNSDRRKRHPVKYAIDGSPKWWQSPTLANGQQYEYVTISIDLTDVYQVAYIIIKSAISPRPGNWILERSLDGIHFIPWQYFAISDEECWNRYKIRAKVGKPSFSSDDEVICTSYYSKIDPLEGGEIHTSLVNGRPGSNIPSETLITFTMARFIRLRFQKIRTLLGDLMMTNRGGFDPNRFWDKSVMRRYFYSISDISIGGHCVCFGHANKCTEGETGKPEAQCLCQHNTCGPRCDHCCPLYNQYAWGPGNSTDSVACEKCECHNHADECVYDPQIHEKSQSLNSFGTFSGGGVCINCRDHTAGINCEQCREGFYRPKNVRIEDSKPCVRCDCHSIGSTGECVKDENMALLLKKNPGDCICKSGYMGRHCNQCEAGYRGFPNCAKCPCNMAGIINDDCDGVCICKENVKGLYCSECKQGYFNLDKKNPEGCTQCFCHGATDLCTSSNFPKLHIMSNITWHITDLHGTKIIPANHINGLYTVSNEEVSGLSMYYWSDSESFSGQKIHSYGLEIIFKVGWILGRGDSTGKPISEYDVIIKSTNSMLAFNQNSYEGNNATISVTLSEINCIVLPDLDNNIIQSESIKRPCNRLDVMECLSGIKRVLIRAKYHTNQIEAQLHFAYLEKADINSIATSSASPEEVATSVEVCVCPLGYSGTSCQECAYGYRTVVKEDSFTNICVKCDCFGHSKTCTVEGECLCEKNTTGVNCELCQDGFYGDPTRSTDNPCKPCQCPLALGSKNNFSPTCELDSSSPFGFKCNACDVNYVGPNCESCANGYFGNPSDPEDFCKPCDCLMKIDGNSEICDRLTGECLMCGQDGRKGWGCEECQVGFFRLDTNCVACDCSEIGSVTKNCHQESGQCLCKENWAGSRSCDQCAEGFTKPNEGCPACNCNTIGSLSSTCDQVTGQCQCRPGITGRFCNKCEDLFYGFSANGCSECECHPDGSDTFLCDKDTGQCHCLPQVQGRQCDECSQGHWNLVNGGGCEPCNCSPEGSNITQNDTCDLITGQCPCKPGVGGLNCLHCLEGYYGFSPEGCKACDPCDKFGHFCDPNSGRCVCPPFTEGENCDKCSVGCWGFSRRGCKPCNCSPTGSVSQQCSSVTGKCQCLSGFEGDKCDKCKFANYKYPHCTACHCNPAGTQSQYCDVRNEFCSCDEFGQCPCKANVIGKKCDQCQGGTYGLDPDDPDGCMSCFCFHKTNQCTQGYFKWQRFGMVNSLNLRIIRSPRWFKTHVFNPYIEGPDRCYVYLQLPDRTITKMTGDDIEQLRVVNNLIVIPDKGEKVIIEKDVSFGTPLYWELPQIFLGDKVLSYNGFLRFHAASDRIAPYFPSNVLETYPLVQIQGNHRLILEHYPFEESSNGYFELKFHEDFWRLKHGPYDGIVTREVMMVALQNIQHIFIRATDTAEFFNATLFNVSLDIAIPSPNMDKSMAHGIEVCECPSEYNSTSCQNPKLGYYRWYKKDFVTSTVVIDLVGEARPCDCNERAETCDTETGACQNCADNTAGPHCEKCATGYYGSPEDHCLPCPCPSIYNNHAETCFKIPGHHGIYNSALQTYGSSPPGGVLQMKFQCKCKVGYTGSDCSRCDYGFFGKPWEMNSYCSPCRCNQYGSVSDECHEITGQCNCRVGVTGRDCSKCAERHVIIGSKCTSCNDGCTGTLLNDLDQISYDLTTHGVIDKEAAATIIRLYNIVNITRFYESKFDTFESLGAFLDDYPNYSDLSRMMSARMGELRRDCESLLRSSVKSYTDGEHFLRTIHGIERESRGIIHTLNDHFFGRNAFKIDTDVATREAQILLNSLKIRDMEFDSSKILEELKNEAINELNLCNIKYDQVLIATSGSNATLSIRKKVKNIRDKMRDISGHISTANRDSHEAERITRLANDLYGISTRSIESIENMTIDMDMSEIESMRLVSEGGYLRTEAEQVLLMLEDIMKELRNITKEVDIRENNLFELIPLYRAQYAQPAFNHVELLKDDAKYMKGILDSLRINGSESLSAVTAYDRIKEGIDRAFEIALNASKSSKETNLKINELLENYSFDQMLNTSTELMTNGLNLTGILENSLRTNMAGIKTTIQDLIWKIKFTNDSLVTISETFGQFEEELNLPELVLRVNEIFEYVNETSTEIFETESKIRIMKKRIDSIRSGVAPNAVDININLENAQETFAQASVKTQSVELKQSRMDRNIENIEDRLKNLRALIKKSRHKSHNIKVSIGPDETGTCFRLYKWDIVEDATKIEFNFAPTRISDSLLFFWPSSINDDYISIEMVNGKIKASWELGSGLRTLLHPKRFVKISENSDDPEFWFEISVERVGSSVRLDVRSKINPISSPIEYNNFGEESTLLNHGPDDLIHIGGFSKEKRSGLVSNGLSGCIHNLKINQRALGLWNFVGNEGCSPCVECHTIESSAMDMLTYHFDGRGYSSMKRIQSKAFNSKFFDISLEFRTYSENALLFLTVNEELGQSVSLEIIGGKMVFKISHQLNETNTSSANSFFNDNIRIETEEKINTGNWTELRAIWFYQREKQTCQLTVGKKSYKQEKRTFNTLLLELYDATYHVGGVIPGGINENKWKNKVQFTPFVGCLKNLLIDSTGYDPVSGFFYGIESPCSGKVSYLTSFEGDGYSEFPSKSMDKDFKFGFSFKTLSPTGLLLLSTFRQSTDSPDDTYYGVYLENGQIHIVIGYTNGHLELMSNETRYDDGKFHYIRLVKKNRRLLFYVNDEEIRDTRIPKKFPNIIGSKTSGLFIGGIPTKIQTKFDQSPSPFKITRGFTGCIRNVYFGNEMLNFMYPVSHSNQNVEQCGPSHDALKTPDFDIPSSIRASDFIQAFSSRTLVAPSDSECYSTQNKISIKSEEPSKAIQFGDTRESNAIINLEKARVLRQNFNLTFSFRTFYPDGLFFQGFKKKNGDQHHQCLSSYLKDGQIIVKIYGHGHGGREQDLVSSITNLNDGEWHQISIVKSTTESEEKMFLYIDYDNVTSTLITTRIKPVTKLQLGGFLPDGQDCFENSIQKPDYFKGCIKNLLVNSHPVSFHSNPSVILHQVNPCFKNVEVGTFFRHGSFAIYSYNLTLGSLMELELEFKSDSRNGILLSFQPIAGDFPKFSIFLNDGKLIAKEIISLEESYEAVQDFAKVKGHVCNGLWHKVRANYDKGSISLRVDNFDPTFGLDEPFGLGSRRSSGSVIANANNAANISNRISLQQQQVLGSLFIGNSGNNEETSRTGDSKKTGQFYGCIRNISINRQRKDWSDMAALNNVFLNSCPAV